MRDSEGSLWCTSSPLWSKQIFGAGNGGFGAFGGRDLGGDGGGRQQQQCTWTSGDISTGYWGAHNLHSTTWPSSFCCIIIRHKEEVEAMETARAMCVEPNT